jgi:hypothetical protein
MDGVRNAGVSQNSSWFSLTPGFSRVQAFQQPRPAVLTAFRERAETAEAVATLRGCRSPG